MFKIRMHASEPQARCWDVYDLPTANIMELPDLLRSRPTPLPGSCVEAILMTPKSLVRATGRLEFVNRRGSREADRSASQEGRCSPDVVHVAAQIGLGDKLMASPPRSIPGDDGVIAFNRARTASKALDLLRASRRKQLVPRVRHPQRGRCSKFSASSKLEPGLTATAPCARPATAAWPTSAPTTRAPEPSSASTGRAPPLDDPALAGVSDARRSLSSPLEHRLLERGGERIT